MSDKITDVLVVRGQSQTFRVRANRKDPLSMGAARRVRKALQAWEEEIKTGPRWSYSVIMGDMGRYAHWVDHSLVVLQVGPCQWYCLITDESGAAVMTDHRPTLEEAQAACEQFLRG